MLHVATIALVAATLILLKIPAGDGRKTISAETCAYSAPEFCCENSKKINFEKDGIVPEVLERNPEYIMKVVYDGLLDSEDTYVCLGNNITSDITLRRPRVSWPAEKGKYYTLIMYGFLLEYNHWLVGNIPGDDVDAGDSISNYFPPVPFPVSGPHIYLFVVFEQPCGKLKFTETENPLVYQNPGLRLCFDFHGFVKKYALKSLRAANFFYDSFPFTPEGQPTLLEGLNTVCPLVRRVV